MARRAPPAPLLPVLLLAGGGLRAAGILATVQDMRLYDDVRSTFADRVVERFRGAAARLPAADPEQRLRARVQLLQAVDAMSYTLGVQGWLEQAPPVPVPSARAAGAAAATEDEGAALWCGLGGPAAADARAHERRVLDRLLEGLGQGGGTGLLGLDVGSGYGGWARRLVLERPEVARITGVEYQQGIHALSRRFTDFAFEGEAQMAERVSFEHGGIREWLSAHRGPPLDFALSFLALLHIGSTLAEKEALLKELVAKLRPRGRVYFEDLVALPAAARGDNPAYVAKLKRVMWMNVLVTHKDYAQLFDRAALRPVGNWSAVAYDVTAAWRHFVLQRTEGFKELHGETQLCLGANGAVFPASRTTDSLECETISGVFGSNDLSSHYLASQRQFFCEVCELFWGLGDLAEGDCGCQAEPQPSEDALSYPQHHPPLVGGVMLFAERREPWPKPQGQEL